MALLPSVFVPSENEKMAGFEPIPAGEYVVEITKSTLKDNSAKTGKRLNFSMVVLEGEAEGKRFNIGCNFIHPKADTQRMARAELRTICDAVGHDGDLEDTEDIHDIPFIIEVSVSGTFNKIRGARPADGEPVAASNDSDDSPFE